MTRSNSTQAIGHGAGRRAAVFAAGLAAALAAGLSTAVAQDAAAFYKGKTFKFIVPAGAGGGYDTYSRLLARNLERNIPGRPTMVVSNMPGASGIRTTNWMYNVAPKDGTVMAGTYNALLLEPLLGSDATKFDMQKFEWIGSIGKQFNTCISWHTSSVKTIEDAMKREVKVSTTGMTGNSAKTPIMLNLLIGTKFKVISGYKTTEMRLAVERGEVDGICGLSYDTYMAANPDWILNKKVNFLLQSGMKKIKELPDVPLLIDYVKDPDMRAALKLLSVRDEVGRPHMFPPGTPKYLVAALRKAFDDTMKDPLFKEDAKRTKIEPDPMTGEEIEKALAEAYKASPKIVALAAKLYPPRMKKKK